MGLIFFFLGKDQDETFGSGTVVRMACGKGYELNMAENKTVKCVKGRWKPEKPTCNISKYMIMYPSKQKFLKEVPKGKSILIQSCRGFHSFRISRNASLKNI